MAPNPKLRTAAEEHMAATREKDSTFGPRPIDQEPARSPRPINTSTPARPTRNGVYRGGNRAIPIPNAVGSKPSTSLRGKVRMRPGESRA